MNDVSGCQDIPAEFFKSSIPSEAEPMAWATRQEHRGEHGAILLCSRRLSHRDGRTGFRPRRTPAGHQGQKRVRVGTDCPSSPRPPQHLGAQQHRAPLHPSRQAVLSEHFGPGNRSLPIPSILGVAPDVANSVSGSLNPTNSPVNPPFKKLSSNYPTWRCFLPRLWPTRLGKSPKASVPVSASVKPV